MKTDELRNLITEYVSNADGKVLRIIKAVFDAYELEEVNDVEEVPEEEKVFLVSVEQVVDGKIKTKQEIVSKPIIRSKKEG